MSKQKLIDKLTPEQEKMIPVYLDRYLQIGLSTEPTDRKKAEAAILASYAYQKLEKPEIIWAEDPFEGQILAAKYSGNPNVKEQAAKASYGSFEAQWVVFYAFMSEVLPVEKVDNLIDIVKDIVTHCGVYWTFEGLVIMTPKPKAIHMKDGKLHNTEGLALEYETGRGVYAVNGDRKSNLFEVMAASKYAEKA